MFHLLPITQGESCLLGASAAPSVDWEWARLVVFKLSPSYPRVPGMWLKGRLGGRSLWSPIPAAPLFR